MDKFYGLEGQLIQLERAAGITPPPRPATTDEAVMLRYYEARADAVKAAGRVGSAGPAEATAIHQRTMQYMRSQPGLTYEAAQAVVIRDNPPPRQVTPSAAPALKRYENGAMVYYGPYMPAPHRPG